jgi:hypothetical protein
MDSKYYSTVSLTAIIVFLTIAYVIYVKFYEGKGTENFEETDETAVNMLSIDQESPDCVTRSKYITDMYPWWRSTRWNNVDGWLYNAPSYGYWRRPSYYNYYVTSKPTIIGGKRFYQRSFY